MEDRKNTLQSRLLSTAATGLVFLSLGMTATAQNAAEDEEAVLDTVVVTGIKGSIQNSLEAKKNATSIVEVISAEDIGKLPDLSIADSLARLPGVTAQRVRGRAQSIAIRGLGPDFSIALLNGREVVSASNNRGIEFDQFPSELIAQGKVYKTPDARLAATGIAGAVDLRTLKPLDYTERQLNLSAKYTLNDNGKLNPDFDDDGYRLFGSYIDQTEDGTIGWALAVTQQSNPTQFFSRELKTNGGQRSIDPVSGLIYASDNPRTGVVSRDFERTSIAGTLQFEPNPDWSTTIDAFYNDTEDAGIFRGVETPIASWSGAQFAGATGSGPFASSATYNAVVPIVRTDTEGASAELFSVGINTAYNFTERLTVTADISNSQIDRNDIDYESYAGTGFARSGAQDTLVYNTPGSGEYSIGHQLDYTDPSVVLLTDPGGWGQVGFIKEPLVDDELNQIRLEAEYDLDKGLLSSVVVGGLMTDREKNFDSNESFIRAGNNFSNGSLAIPASAIVGATDSGSIGLDVIAYDTGRLRTDGSYTFEKATFDTEWKVEEQVSTFYAMANLEGDVGETPFRGNVGFQFVDTTQDSTGTLAGIGIQTISYDYTDFLPSLNLSFEVAPDTFIKAAAARTLTRPRMDDLAANQSISVNSLVCADTNSDGVPDVLGTNFDPTVDSGSCYNLSGGNVQLEPYRATSFDVSFEKYIDETSSFALALFHKELEDYILPVASVINAAEQIRSIGDGAFLDANPQVANARLNGDDNVADGAISGIEATLNLGLDRFLPENLEGFGFYGTYTYADNGLETSTGATIDIPNYSETTWAANVYYENHGWSTRLSARHRSDFLAESPLFDGSLIQEMALEETVFDFKVGYEWEHGPLEGFSANFEIFNLTNEPFVTENELLDANGNSVGSFVSKHEEYGTTYNFTLSKSF